jgi:hypothetical protein
MSEPPRSKEFPLGIVTIESIGWNRQRFLQLGRASWVVKRGHAFEGTTVTYRNLEQERDWPLGTLPPAKTDEEILEMIASHTDSHTPADWVVLDDRVLAFTADRGEA